MLFFRSEDDVATWCRAAGIPVGPTTNLAQLWGLAHAWYANRLEPEAVRPSAEEIPGIFRNLGLTEDFWNPLANNPVL